MGEFQASELVHLTEKSRKRCNRRYITSFSNATVPATAAGKSMAF